MLTVFGVCGFGAGPIRFLHDETGTFADFYANFDRVLLANESLWFSNQPRDERYRRVIAEALNVRVQPWRGHQQVMMSYLPFQGKLPRLLRWLRFNRMIYLPGGRATVQQGQIYRSANRQTTFAPNYRFIADMSIDEAYSNMPGGPSESPFSKWYCSGLGDWLAGRYKTLRAPVAIRSRAQEEL